ncbi:MAG: hypothetical protein K2X28_00620 [Alphaproteobacteria bacterium]|nr:hypothetical protein [Alphaproteobacteria bacterium]
MFFSRFFIVIILFFTSYIFPLKLSANPIEIDSLDKVIDHVRSLRSRGISGEKIGIILDCHGVITNEESHHTSHTLKDNILEALKYFHDEKVSVVVATAWDDLDAVVQYAIINLGLGDFFEVTPGKKTLLKYFSVGSEGNTQLEGHRNGKIVALRSIFSINHYFRQKAFALEVVYPGKVFTHIAGVDDDRYNLKIFEHNFLETRHYKDKCNLTLFHLQSSKVSPALSLSEPSSYVLSTQPSAYIPPSVVTLPVTFDSHESSTDEEREQFYDGYGSDTK